MAVRYLTRPAGAPLSQPFTETKGKRRLKQRTGLRVGFDPERDSAPVDAVRGSGNAAGMEVRYGN